MKKTGITIIAASLLLVGLATSQQVWAMPSADFNETSGDIFDEWGIFRTRAFGKDGFYQLSETTFRPVIAFESLGKELDRAYRLGEHIAAEYPDRIERAEAIFHFVRDRVVYTPDIDQFRYDEFAQNADEIAITIDQYGIAYGDCEDSAVLLAVMYRGAGLRSAIALGEGHTAALVYLPDYNKATAVFELDGEAGWLWAEATGKNNPLGWVPKEFIGTGVAAYEIGEEEVYSKEPTAPSTAVAPMTEATPSSFRPPLFLIVLGILLLASLLRRGRQRVR
ncbi:MAG: transglutaminase domain-containing protein [Dehalococcoidales bacterium]|nr:transglutaminase domain-containing protein [Dehalococcoidales bacterium]